MASATPQASSFIPLQQDVPALQINNNFVAMTPDDLRNLTQAVIKAQQHAQNPTGNEERPQIRRAYFIHWQTRRPRPNDSRSRSMLQCPTTNLRHSNKESFLHPLSFQKRERTPLEGTIPSTKRRKDLKTMPWPNYRQCDKERTLSTNLTPSSES